MKYLLFGIFVIIPIAEIATFIQVGNIIGLWPTLGIILLTAFLGTGLLRYQGMATLNQAQGSLNNGELPLTSVIHGVFLLVAGLLLLTPGFITDIAGFLLFIPPLRLFIAKWAIEKFKASQRVHVSSDPFDDQNPGASTAAPVIEGEFTIAEEDGGNIPASQKSPKSKSSPCSPWQL